MSVNITLVETYNLQQLSVFEQETALANNHGL